MNNEFEFENMRQQMDTLKKKLEKQEIVNDNMIRYSMKNTVSTISRHYFVIIAIAIVVIPFTYLVFVTNLGLSLAFWVGTAVFMLVCAGATFYNQQNVDTSSIMSSNLVEVSRKMARAKKFDANWLYFGIPAVVLWLAWLTWEIYQVDTVAAHYNLYGVICGAVIGSFIGIKTHLRIQHQYQDIIDQIEEVTKE